MFQGSFGKRCKLDVEKGVKEIRVRLKNANFYSKCPIEMRTQLMKKKLDF